MVEVVAQPVKRPAAVTVIAATRSIVFMVLNSCTRILVKAG
jgi:hypothetical protein